VDAVGAEGLNTKEAGAVVIVKLVLIAGVSDPSLAVRVYDPGVSTAQPEKVTTPATSLPEQLAIVLALLVTDNVTGDRSDETALPFVSSTSTTG
jgi:hypothetical protein